MKTDTIAAELVSRGRLAEARVRLASLAAAYNSSVDWNDLGAVQFALQEWPEAEKSFRRALELDASNAQAGANLAALLVQTGRGAEAVPILHRALPHLQDEERDIAAALLQQCQPSAAAVAGIEPGPEPGPSAVPPSPRRNDPSELTACVDAFLECAMTNPATRQEAWAYLNQRIWSYLQRLPDDFGPDSAYLHVAQAWMNTFIRCFVAGEAPGGNWRIEQARAALRPLAAMMGLHLGDMTAPPPVAAVGEIPGLDRDRQAGLLNEFNFAYRDELESFPERAQAPDRYFLRNGIYEGADGDSLYCVVRHLQPRQILHFGSANTAFLAAQALAKNRELDPRAEACLIAFDPYPNAWLQDGSPGMIESIRSRIRDLTPDHLAWEGPGILFVDANLVLREPEDADHLLDVLLPALPAGAWVHLHDVACAGGVPRLLRSLAIPPDRLSSWLNGNDSFEVMLALDWLHASRETLARDAFPHMDVHGGHSPTAFWMRRR